LNEHLYAVIMAGGIGSRLWPRSRAASPKQFLDLLGPRTMLQETVDRMDPLIPLDRVLIVVSKDHAGTVRDQVPGLPEENIIVEPGPRGTAPCAGLAGVVVQGRDPEAIMAVCPADHLIADAGGFRQALGSAAELARDDYLVTLGIGPDHPHTGYGYIQRSAPLGERNGLPTFQVRRFTEKPDATTAQGFVDSGEYYWNGGIFVWQAATILAAWPSCPWTLAGTTWATGPRSAGWSRATGKATWCAATAGRSYWRRPTPTSTPRRAAWWPPWAWRALW
jgi:mannose-1-phosphate guanylyltransferase